MDTKEYNDYLKTKTCLVVDDDEDNLTPITLILKRKFQSVFSALSGDEAIALYLENKPDLVITDLSMPIMNGIDLSIKLLEINHDCKIIYLSGHNEQSYFDKIKDIFNLSTDEQIMDRYMTKPVIIQNLLQKAFYILKPDEVSAPGGN